MQKAVSQVELWAENLSALPKSSALRTARAAHATACIEAEAAQRALTEHCRRCAGLRREFLDRDALESERQLLAANVRLREAAAAVDAAKREAAPAILKHLQRHQPESLSLLIEALEHVAMLAGTITTAFAEAEIDGCSAPYPLQKARRILTETQNALVRLRS